MLEKIVPNIDSNELINSFKNLSGSQICSFYNDVDDLKQSIIPLISMSLDLHKKVIIIANGQMIETIFSYCLKLNDKINTYIQNNQFSLITINNSDLEKDKFFPHGVVYLIATECGDAKNIEYSGVLVIHDINYALEHISDLDKLIEYEASLNQQLQNLTYTSISLFSSEILGFGLLNSIIDLYPNCYINSEIYPNLFYIPPKCYIGEDIQLSVFKSKLKKLSQNKNDKETSFLNQYIEIRRHLYKVMHDLKAPIRTAHITNNMLQKCNQLDSSESKDLLLIMSKSLIQAYDQIDAFEAMIETFDTDTL